MLSKEQQQQAVLIFEEALDQAAEARLDWVGEKCAGEPALAERVIALLEADIDASAQNLTGHFVSQATSPIPNRIGPYHIVGQLGEGGMGAVYRGERDDGAFSRTVAIKFVHQVGVGSEVAARFHAERRILADMQHPNIAQMLDGGDVDGRPYLVMEYIDGNFFTYDATQSIRKQLERFCKVCDALSYAHSKLVLHRDIKPSNILIMEDGEPKLLDFGVAKILSDLGDEGRGLTGVLGMPVTPNYCAPEYLAGEAATVAGEIYSLGVLLHELLIGRVPHSVAGLTLPEAYRDAINNSQNVGATGNQDLDVILKTALHVDPQRRYISVDALRQDVENFLANRPISRRRDELVYSLNKFVMRNKTLVSVIAGSIVLLVGAATATTFAYIESEASRQLAVKQTEIAEQTVAFLSSALSGANPYNNLGTDITLRQAMEFAESNMEEQFSNSPELKSILMATLASIYSGQGQIEKSLLYADQVYAEVNSNHGQVYDWRHQTYLRLAEVYLAAGQFNKAITLSKKLDRSLRLEDDLNWEMLARNLNAQALALTSLGKFTQALSLLNQVQDIHHQEQVLPAEFMAAMHNNLASAYYSQDSLASAESHMAKSVEYMEEAGLLDTINGLRVQANWASLLGSLKEFDRAERLFLSVLPKMRAALGPAHQWLLWESANFGRMYLSAGRPEKTVQLLEPFLKVIEEHRPQHDEASALLLIKLAYGMCDSGKPSQGLEVAKTSLTTRARLLPTGHWSIGEAQSLVGLCLMRLNRLVEAEGYLISGKDIYVATLGETSGGAQLNQQWLDELQVKRGKNLP